jgi:predicted enzyme related to lactoylglutathione lyase
MATKGYLKIKDMSPLLLVANHNHSQEFYTKNLGFQISFCYEDFYAGITKDGYIIHLKIGSPVIEERENRRKNKDIDITFSVERLEDLYEDIKSKSIEIIQPLREMSNGREFYISDPDGYIIPVVEGKVKY